MVTRPLILAGLLLAGCRAQTPAGVPEHTTTPKARATAPVPAAATPSQGSQAHELARPWIEDALQIRDASKRDAAIERVRSALSSSDVVEAQAGLIALNGIRTLAFDKAALRPSVLPHLKADDSWMRLQAMYALDATGRESGDLERVLAASDGIQGDVRPMLVNVLSTFSGGDLTGGAGERVLDLLRQCSGRAQKQALSGLWGARVSPGIETCLLDLSRSPDADAAHNAIYFGLSTLREKSEAVVDRLIDVVGDPDWNNSGRALWGLGQGVPPALQSKVADAMVRVIETRTDPQSLQYATQSLRQYGSELHAAALQGMADSPGIDPARQRTLTELAAQIRQRAARPR